MGLDASVCCNCYELGKLREPPPHADYIYVDECGLLVFDTDHWKADVSTDDHLKEYRRYPLEGAIEFDHWVYDRACEHRRMILLRHRIGNLWLVSGLRADLRREAPKFPIILEKVLYSGFHCGDWLPLETVQQLKPELEALADFQCEDPEMTLRVPYFRQQMIELVEAALSVGKPICF